MSKYKRNIKGITYLYDQVSYRDENGRPRTRQKLLGKIDPVTGELVPTRKSKSQNTPPVNKSEAIIPEVIKEKAKPPRTKAIAEKNTSILPCPEKLAVPTSPDYQHSISLHHEGKAYLEKLISTEGLEFENGKMFFEGALEPISTVELQDMRTNEGIEEIDIPLLTMYYSIILASFQKMLKQGLDFRIAANQITTIYAPDLMKCLDTLYEGSGTNENEIKSVMRKTATFHNVIGIHHITRNGKPDKSYFPVLTFAGYDAENNTISFISPYLMYIVRKIYSASIKNDKKGKPRLKRNGLPMLSPSNSFLIKSSIVGERNKAAVENVMIIIKVIEQAGDKGTPHIKASTIIERNEALKQRLSKSTNPVQLLSRVFKRTWELLRNQTTLLETYEGIELPDPDDIRNIPTPSNMDTLIFEFPHKGKRKKNTDD